MAKVPSNSPKISQKQVTGSAGVPNMQLAPGKTSRAQNSADIPSMQMAPGSSSNSESSSSKKDSE